MKLFLLPYQNQIRTTQSKIQISHSQDEETGESEVSSSYEEHEVVVKVNGNDNDTTSNDDAHTQATSRLSVELLPPPSTIPGLFSLFSVFIFSKLLIKKKKKDHKFERTKPRNKRRSIVAGNGNRSKIRIGRDASTAAADQVKSKFFPFLTFKKLFKTKKLIWKFLSNLFFLKQDENTSKESNTRKAERVPK